VHAHDTSFAILLLLGAAHGINPAMGWLFAVSLGLQEQRRVAVWRAFAPLALGHGLAIAAALAGALAVGIVLPLGVLKWLVAAALVAMGVRQLMRHRHPRWGGMRIGARDLAVWSFLMASAHGAGLMALPFLLGPAAGSSAHAGHAAHAGSGTFTGVLTAGIGEVDAAALLGTAVHTAGYLVVAAVIAVIVYEKVGLRILRRAWINLDLIWAGALIVTGLLTPLW
jgi:hypothetical protein